MKLRPAILFSSLYCLCLTVSAQKIDSMMAVYAERFPQEKIYVQFDKNVYTPGETIWYKAYLLAGTEPSRISRNFYTELSDGRGNIVQRKTAPVNESASAGSFDIPAGFKGNHFHFRAYTSWMMNFDTAFLFERDIRIIQATKDSSIVPDDGDDILQFFPEGGDIIAGLENTIAFKGTDRYGSPVSVKGVVRDPSGKDVLEFQSSHDGMGKFLLIPDKGDVFYATCTNSKGKEFKVDLPPVKAEGVTLRVLNGGKKIIFSVARSTGSSLENNQLIVMAHMNQHLVYKATVRLQEILLSSGSIPVDQLPTGVLQITVFNNNLRPVAERVLFVNNHEFEFLSNVEIEKKAISRRGLNTINIVVPDTLSSNLSVAITDFDLDGRKKDEENIISRLLMSSELKGRIYSPYYYFSNDADSTRQQLDLVMLTHGWRRFNWDMLAARKIPQIKFPNRDYLVVGAEVLGVDPTRIASNESINLIMKKKDSSMQILELPRIGGGKFAVSGLIFYDTAKGFYSFNANRKLSSEAAIIFNNGLFSGYKYSRPIFISDNSWTAGDSAFLRKNRFVLEETVKNKEFLNKRVQTLETVTVRGRQKTATQKLDEEYTSGLFTGGDAYVFNLLNDPVSAAYGDIFNYLTGRVAGLTVVTDPSGGGYLSWRGSRTDLYLDEVKVAATQLRSVSISQIAMVKVFRPGTVTSIGGGAGGSVAIYTRKGGDKIADPNIKGLDQITILGYSAIKQFFVPNYLEKSDLDDISDVRTTLYWNPNVLLDKSNNKMSISFYNNDITTKMRIIVEGVNEEGKLTRIEKIIQ
ncbi:MAG: hypothetical protein ACHQEM_00385 [Chitinophagales bacterium]